MNHERLALRLYRTHRDTLVNYAARLLGDRSKAEDVVQDAWLIFDQLPDQHGVRDPIAYLWRIVRNQSFNALRRINQYQKIAGGDADGVRLLADQSPSAEQQAIARQSLDRFMERLALLPDRQKTAIRMHRLEGYKMREIAALLGISIPMVHTLIADGLVKCADPSDEDG